jgi:hypothetical protein
MTYLRSVPSDFEDVLQLPPGMLVPSSQPAAGHAPTRVAETFLVAVRGLAMTMLRAWRQAVEARRARHRLMQLDDHPVRGATHAALEHVTNGHPASRLDDLLPMQRKSHAYRS